MENALCKAVYVRTYVNNNDVSKDYVNKDYVKSVT